MTHFFMILLMSLGISLFSISDNSTINGKTTGGGDGYTGTGGGDGYTGTGGGDGYTEQGVIEIKTCAGGGDGYTC